MNSDPHNTLPDAAGDFEPRAEKSPAPLALIIFFALLVFWGMLYLDDHGGGFNPRVYAPYDDYAMVADLQPKLDPAKQLPIDGEKIFNNNCAICHQANGSGGANGCPPLAGSDWAAGGGPNRIVRLVLNGGNGPIKVSGKDYPGTTTMTPFKDTLTDYQLAAALSYVRTAWGNHAAVVLPEQVKKIRDATSSRRVPWTPTDLLALPDKD